MYYIVYNIRIVVYNLFKVNCKDTRTTSIRVVQVYLLLTLNRFSFFIVFISEFGRMYFKSTVVIYNLFSQSQVCCKIENRVSIPPGLQLDWKQKEPEPKKNYFQRKL